MTIIVSVFGVIGRFAGDLLTSATGWAGSLMYGRVPQDHRRYLGLMMGGSVVWAILVIVFVVPGLAAWGLSTTPHPSFIDGSWVAFVVTLGVILMPLVIGAAAYLAPAEGRRSEGVRGVLELARGYLLAPVICGLLVFLALVGIVRKSRSARHGWSDTHIPIVVPPRGYDDTVETIRQALTDAGMSLRVEAEYSVLSLPAWLLTHVDGSNVGHLRPDRLMELSGPDVRVGIYPSDIAVSTTAEMRTPIRATILAALAHAEAHLTTSAEAQKVEDRLREITAAAASGGTRDELAELDPIDRSLLTLDVPSEEWDILYRLRLQAERDLLRRVLDGTATTVTVPRAVPVAGMEGARPPSDAPARPGIESAGDRREPHASGAPAL